MNKALLYTRVGPSVMRLLLAHLEIDLPELLRRYGDPSKAPPGAPVQRTLSAKEEAIITAARFAPGATEREIRALADEYDPVLQDAPPIAWLETLLREVQRRILIPQRQDRVATRRKQSDQRALRKLHDAMRPEPAAAAKEAPAAATGKRSGGR